MNRDVFAGKWKQLRGRIKQTGGDLTDDEFVQERYGRERVAQEIDRYLDEAADFE